MPHFCLSFQNPEAIKLTLSGGKGANLAKIKQAGFNVPDGFVVTTLSFEQFFQQSDSLQNLFKEVNSFDLVDIHQISIFAKKATQLITGSHIPQNVEAAIREAYTTAGYASVAVRSSATAEDLPFASFAGQQDSFLNVHGMDQVLQKIKLCWASLFNDRSIIYRMQNHIDHSAVQMAVCVQNMVPSETSGILFTADPVTNHHGHLVINAGFGLGEGLVMGLVNPDQITVEKSTGKILSNRLGDKKKLVQLDQKGGTILADVPPSKVSDSALSNEQIGQLTQTAINIEQLYTAPQDIEWAISNGEVFILQSRPITSLFPIPSPRPDGTDCHIYFSIGHAQMITDPISPMGISILRLLLPFGRPPRKSGYSPYLKQAGGRIYVDLTSLLNTEPGRKMIPKALSVAEPLSATQLKDLVDSTGFDQRNQHSSLKAKPIIILQWFLPLFFRMVSRLIFRSPYHASSIVLEKSNQFLKDLADLFANTPRENKLKVIRETTGPIFHKRLIWMGGMFGSGQLARVILEKLLSKKEIDFDLQDLQRGLQGNITTEMDLSTGDLADLVMHEPGLQTLLKQIIDGSQTYTKTRFSDFPQFYKEWLEFLKRFGMRGNGELDISRPRYADNPLPIFQTILARASSTSTNHRDHYQSLKERNLTVQKEIISTFRSSIKGRLQLPLVKRLLKVAVNLMPIREHPKYVIMLYFEVLRKEILGIADHLVQNGALRTRSDVWYLSFAELEAWFSNPTDISELIQERKNLYNHFTKLNPPRVISSDGLISHKTLQREGIPSGAMVGSAVSAGTITGIARVILDPALEQLNPGEILVAPYTDPGWTPLFINAAGIVLEVGGLMTHGSVVAREYGLPAVVGVVNATGLIKSGMHLRVNGDLGYVEIIED